MLVFVFYLSSENVSMRLPFTLVHRDVKLRPGFVTTFYFPFTQLSNSTSSLAEFLHHYKSSSQKFSSYKSEVLKLAKSSDAVTTKNQAGGRYAGPPRVRLQQRPDDPVPRGGDQGSPRCFVCQVTMCNATQCMVCQQRSGLGLHSLIRHQLWL